MDSFPLASREVCRCYLVTLKSTQCKKKSSQSSSKFESGEVDRDFRTSSSLLQPVLEVKDNANLSPKLH